MDTLTLPALVFFAIGLGITLLAGSLWKWGRGGSGLDRYQMRNGAVRLDGLSRGPAAAGRAADAGAPRKDGVAVSDAEEPAPPSRRQKPAPRGRRSRNP